MKDMPFYFHEKGVYLAVYFFEEGLIWQIIVIH